MKKNLLLSPLILLIFSCQDGYKSNLEKMAKETKSIIEEAAFKDNGTVDFLLYEPIGYDTLTAKDFYMYQMSRLSEIIDDYVNMVHLLNEQFDNEVNLFSLYSSSFGRNDNITRIQKEDAAKAKVKFEIARENAYKLFAKDSLLKIKIDNLDNFEDYYLFKAFAKYVYSNKDETSNFLDTIFMVFDKNFKKVDNIDFTSDLEKVD